MEEPCIPCKEAALKAAQQGVHMARSFGRPRIQSDGTIHYPKKGDEPPPDMDGYRRDGANNWRFIPMWQACSHRHQTQHMKACGAVGILSICTHPEGPKENKQEVSFATCQGCPLRK